MTKRSRLAVSGVLAVTTIIVGALAGCTGADTGSLSGGTVAAPPTAITHVHAVDVDESRSLVTIATHDGLITVDISDSADTAQPATVLGDYRGDVMGFVRAGDRLLLSGHPPYGSNDAPNVGVLNASLDAREWSPLALSGEVDFHAMSIASSGSTALIAGIDSATSEVLTSNDVGVSWQRGTAIAARDIAVGVDGASLIATTESGLQGSDDRGETWNPIAGTPLLVLIESGFDREGNAALFGVDVEGVLHSSADGIEWMPTGALPFAPEAFGVSEGGTIVIVSTERAMRSIDGGATWIDIANMMLPLAPPQ
jgi:hypothetical protein